MQARPGTIVVQKGHPGSVMAMRFRPDGRVLAVVPFAGSIHFRDADGTLIDRLRVFNAVLDVRWLPSGGFVAASPYGEISVRDEHGIEISAFRCGDSASSMALDPSGSIIAVEGRGVIGLWDLEGRFLRNVFESEEGFHRIGFVDATTILAPGGGRIMMIKTDGTIAAAFDRPGEWINTVHGGRDGALLVAADSAVWYAAPGASACTPAPGPGSGVTCARFNPQGTRFACGFDDGMLRVFDARGLPVREAHTGMDCVIDLAWHPGGGIIAASSGVSVCVLGAGGDVRWTVHPDYSRLYAFGFGPDGAFVPYLSRESMFDAMGLPDEAKEHLSAHSTIMPVGEICSLDILPDGSVAAACGSALRVYAPDGSVLGEYSADGCDINTAAVSADGSRVAAACRDGLLRVWDGGSPPRVLAELSQPAMHLAWSPDGSMLAASYMAPHCAIDVFSLSGDRRTLEGHAGEVTSLSFSPGGDYLVSGARDGVARVWGLDGASAGVMADPDSSRVCAVDAGPDGLVVTGTETGAVRYWRNGRCVRTIRPRQDDGVSAQAVRALSGGRVLCAYNFFRNDGREIVIVLRDASGEPAQTITMPGMSYGVDLRFAACERAGLIACSIVNRIYLFSFDGAKMGEIKVADARITAMDINSDGDDLVASGYEDGSLEFRRFSGEVVSRRDFDAGAVTAVSIAGRVVLAASDLGSVGVFDRSGNVISFFSAGGEVTAMAISPSGDTVALGCGDGSLRFFSVTGEPIREIPGGAAYDAVMRIAFSPDASLVAAGYSFEYLRVLDRAGNEVRRIPGYSGMLLMHAFDPSGRSLLFGDVDNDLEVIDTADWSPVATLVAAGEDYAVFTPDGRFDYTSPEMGARLVMKGKGGTVLPLSEEFRRQEGLARRFFAQNP